VMVTVVLLKLASMKAMPAVTFFFFVVVLAAFDMVLRGNFRSEWNDGYLRSFTPFLPATVFLGPLRVRALVRVR